MKDTGKVFLIIFKNIAVLLMAEKNIKVMHKMANQKFVAKTSTAARFVK